MLQDSGISSASHRRPPSSNPSTVTSRVSAPFSTALLKYLSSMLYLNLAAVSLYSRLLSVQMSSKDRVKGSHSIGFVLLRFLAFLVRRNR